MPSVVIFITQTIAFTCMGIGFIWDLVSFYRKKGEHYRDLKSPIVTIGVLGTFAGIYIGLQGFDTGDISGSLPRLLEGLKTAFLTSIVGMSLALLLTAIQKIRPSSHTEDGLINNYISSIAQNLESLKLSPRHFQELDSAVKNIIVWHSTYMKSLTQIEQQQTVAKESLEIAGSVLSGLAQTQTVLVDSIQQLDGLLPKMKDHTDTLSTSLSFYQDNSIHLKEYNERLKATLEEIRRIPDTIGRSMERATTAATTEISKLASSATEKSMAAVEDAAKEANKISAKAVAETMAEIEKMPRLMTQTMEQSADAASRGMSSLTPMVQKAATDALHAVNQQMEQLPDLVQRATVSAISTTSHNITQKADSHTASILTAWETTYLERWKIQVSTAMEGVGNSLADSAKLAAQQHSSALSQISRAIDNHGNNIEQSLVKTEDYINSISKSFQRLSTAAGVEK